MEYIETGKQISSAKLKAKLIQDGLKTEQCELCGIIEWLGKKLPFELHHKNGNHFDNSLDNLQILCPNCHSQTDNFRSRNRTKVLSAQEETLGVEAG